MKKILIVNAHVNGHHPFYLSLIVKSLISDYQISILGEYTESIRVFFEQQEIHSAAPDWIKPSGMSIEDIYAQSLSVARQVNAFAVFYTYLDSFLEHVLSENSKINHEVTGIWFHPHALDRKYGWLPGLDKRSQHRKMIHKRLNSIWITSNIEKIFFLDPNAPQRLSKLNRDISGLVLPDPGVSMPVLDKAAARRYFKLPEAGKIVFLHIGTSEKRKGLSDTIRAFHRALSDPIFRERAYLLRVGVNDKLSSRDRARLTDLVKNGNAGVTDQFASEEDFIEYFSAADVVLIPYRKFRFSSGILANAMNSGCPVIASDYGMIGEVVKKMTLSRCYKDCSVSSLANALVKQCRSEPQLEDRIDTFKAQADFKNIIDQSFQHS
jgi:glycosyltransferase involved in cell wall biosynthesis